MQVMFAPSMRKEFDDESVVERNGKDRMDNEILRERREGEFDFSYSEMFFIDCLVVAK